MNEKDILDLEKSFDTLRVFLNSDDRQGEILSILNNSIDDFLIDCHTIVEDITDKKISQIGFDDFKKLSKIFDMLGELFKKCIKGKPEFISKISEESELIWKSAREIAHDVYEGKIKKDQLWKPFNIYQNDEKLMFLEELKTYLTDDDLRAINILFSEVQKKKDFRNNHEESNVGMANDGYEHGLTDI